MRGQHIGTYKIGEDGNDGEIILNIDETSSHFSCEAFINPSNKLLPKSVAYFVTESRSSEHKSVALLKCVHPKTGYQVEWDQIKHLYPNGVVQSKSADVSIKSSDREICIEAKTDIGLNFSSILEIPPKDPNSKIEAKEMSWKGFKSYISDKSMSAYLYRGQRKPWKLQTLFHRSGRYLISKFLANDVKQLHRRLSTITSHYFDLAIPDQNGAFFNLLQHHGYPTPLLDWSYSPYVASFFAFRRLPKNHTENGNIRIFIFDNEQWQRRYPQIKNVDPLFLHFSVMEFIGIDNSRLVPQQAITTVTNVDDIEAYISKCEGETGCKFIEAIDIPAKERDVVMRELKFMGITAGSMFPSLDGFCEELREENF